MLIDAGEHTHSQDIINFIQGTGIRTLNYVIATHPHSDHIGGMAAVIDAFDVKNVYMPKIAHTTVTFERLLDTIDAKGLSIQTARAGKILFDYGTLKAEIIAPNKDKYEDLNNYSAVILLTYGSKKFLFMGDAEKEIEAEILSKGDISADVIKIGHHGSHTSTTQNFINAVNPSIAIISVGQDNKYGHPSAAVLSTLEKASIDIWRTDETGTILIKSDGETITHAMPH
ncbi:MAG: MBL fold metallo-hydrolase [Peptococcaceae bacterium]|nr:MBL fold metallo-hydrolase [Peptococcaceae bacterium]